MPGMNLVDPALWNSTIQGKANPLSVPKAPRFGGRGYNPRPDPGLSGRGLVQAATGGVAPAASPGGPTVNTAPGANLATAVPGASKPDFTPIRTSAGGSMVLGKDNLGVEEIRGTGHPSAQLYQAAGVGEAYPGAVAGWRSGLAREQGETERAGSLRQAEIEKANIEAASREKAASAEWKRPDVLASQKAIEQKTAQELATKNKTAWGEGFEQTHGTWNPEKKKLEVNMDESLYRIQQKAHSLIDQGMPIDQVNKAIEPDIQRHYYTPENVLGAISLYQQKTGAKLTPQAITDLQSGHPEAMATLYPWIREFLNQPKPGWWESNFGVRPQTPGAALAPVDTGTAMGGM